MKELENSIQRYLQEQIQIGYQKELRKHRTATDKKKISVLAQLEQDYAFDGWLARVGVAIQDIQSVGMSLGTHIAKGVHSSSKSANILSLKDNNLPSHLVSTASLTRPMLDINNSNTATHIAKLKLIVCFLNIAHQNGRFYEFILSHDKAMHELFEKYFTPDDFDYLYAILNPNGQGQIGVLDKQILYAVGDDEYHLLSPNYPSSLSHDVYLKISRIKFERPDDKNAPYSTVHQLAILNLGGTKPQNVSVLNQERGGRHYLLPSYPPTFTGSSDLSFAKSAKTIFGKSLAYAVKDDVDELFNLIIHTNKNHKNTIGIRTARDDILQNIIVSVLQVAHAISQREAGWSKSYKLALHQKYWLDPKRCELDGEDKFKKNHDSQNWQSDVQKDFAHWIQNELNKRLVRYQHEQKKQNKQAVVLELGRAEFEHWQKEFKDTFNASLRLGQGVFV
ncbi:MAG: type I-F CRISPR-associated protein Csy1 [Moraxella sp.]|nr:type I-F CRISPR-associated protein Csy1 [Moraxella sp.]